MNRSGFISIALFLTLCGSSVGVRAQSLKLGDSVSSDGSGWVIDDGYSSSQRSIFPRYALPNGSYPFQSGKTSTLLREVLRARGIEVLPVSWVNKLNGSGLTQELLDMGASSFMPIRSDGNVLVNGQWRPVADSIQNTLPGIDLNQSINIPGVPGTTLRQMIVNYKAAAQTSLVSDAIKAGITPQDVISHGRSIGIPESQLSIHSARLNDAFSAVEANQVLPRDFAFTLASEYPFDTPFGRKFHVFYTLGVFSMETPEGTLTIISTVEGDLFTLETPEGETYRWLIPVGIGIGLAVLIYFLLQGDGGSTDSPPFNPIPDPFPIPPQEVSEPSTLLGSLVFVLMILLLSRSKKKRKYSN